MKTTSTETFKQNATVKHEGFYTYDKAVWVSNKTKLVITCPVHGDFEQSPNNHLTGYGCKACAIQKVAASQSGSLEIFINKAKEKHGDKYTYDKTIYTSVKNPVTITCPIHGDFVMTPGNHTHKTNPQGCPSCGRLVTRQKRTLKQEKVIALFKQTHGDTYDYSTVVYDTYHTKVAITCPIHGKFHQTPAHHINGNGCPACNRTGFNKDTPAIIYYLKINDGEAYKIGITNRTVETRFSAEDLYKIEVLFTYPVDKGYKAYFVEQQLLKQHADKKCGSKLLQSGNTELFNQDCISLLDIEGIMNGFKTTSSSH